MYGPHPNQELHELFKRRPWQGQDPSKASVLFLALDANYSLDVDINLIKKYHDNGPAFWKSEGVHHPFLTSAYNSNSGKYFHRQFQRMGLSSVYADHISFIELLEYPTVGSRANNTVQYNDDHLRWIDSHIQSTSLTFILSGQTGSGVYPEMLRLKKYGHFAWLTEKPIREGSSLPLLYRSDTIAVYRPYHFSCQGRPAKTLRNEQLPEMKRLITEVCSKFLNE